MFTFFAHTTFFSKRRFLSPKQKNRHTTSYACFRLEPFTKMSLQFQNRLRRLFYQDKLNAAVLPAIVHITHIHERTLASVSDSLEARL